MNIPVKFKQGILIGSFATDPDGYDEGQIYWNTTDKKFRQYNGTVWADLKPTPAEFISTDAGQTAVLGSDDKILVPASSGGKQKQSIMSSGRTAGNLLDRFYTFQVNQGFNNAFLNFGILVDGDGNFTYAPNTKGIPIPTGYKINKVELVFSPGQAGELVVNFTKKVNNGLQTYANGDFQRMNAANPPDYTLFLQENLKNPVGEPSYAFVSSETYKRTYVFPTTGGINEYTNNLGGSLMFAVRNLENTGSVIFELIIEIEEI